MTWTELSIQDETVNTRQRGEESGEHNQAEAQRTEGKERVLLRGEKCQGGKEKKKARSDEEGWVLIE